jgi:hypothetical protein
MSGNKDPKDAKRIDSGKIETWREFPAKRIRRIAKSTCVV